MSFILDALKKSEHERQRQTMPGLVESGVARPRARLPTWVIVVCALLAINLIVLLFVLARGWLAAAPQSAETPPPKARASTDAQLAATTGGGAADKPFSPLDVPPEYAPEIPVPATDATRRAAQPSAFGQSGLAGSVGSHPARHREGAAGAAAGDLPAAGASGGGGPVLNDGDYKANDEEVLPSINEINLTGAQALPELHLDVHVFATKAAERFVFINMRKYHEGATLQEGPTLERIRRDGVILNYNGLRFLLPRQ